MKTEVFKLFKAMYLSLDKIWEDNQEEDLRIYLSDADPIFFENGKSMDPVVFEDFEVMYNKAPSNMGDYDFLLEYLSNLDSYYGDIKKYFLMVPKEEFEKSLANS